MTPLFIKGRPTCQTCGEMSINCQCGKPNFPVSDPRPWLDEVLAMPEDLRDNSWFNTEYYLQQRELEMEGE